jgi:hypothetical protein
MTDIYEFENFKFKDNFKGSQSKLAMLTAFSFLSRFTPSQGFPQKLLKGPA